MKIEVWSDVVCPWCYIGKRRLERALDLYAGGDPVEVSWRAFQLSPEAPRFGEPGSGQTTETHLADRFGPEQLLEMRERVAAIGREEGLAYPITGTYYVNTTDAHRLIHAANGQGLGGELLERLFRAQLVEGLRIDDPQVLTDLAAEAGLPAATAVATLAGDAHLDAVQAEIAEAHALGAGGVPFFVVDRRYGISGAQPVELLVEALERAAADAAASSAG